MLTAIIDYESGNLHSAEKAFQRMARDMDAGEVIVTSDADVVARADRLVLPGDGAFPACAAELTATTHTGPGAIEPTNEKANMEITTDNIYRHPYYRGRIAPLTP